MLGLLPMSDRAKDTDILAMRHQLSVLERQLCKKKARFTAGHRPFLAALLHRLPRVRGGDGAMRAQRLPRAQLPPTRTVSTQDGGG
ncbi:hypothetical protein GCM10022206_58220 [Streptomyces chiangmaiensis]